MMAETDIMLSRALAALARLLDYPSAELQANAAEVAEVLASGPVLEAAGRDAVRTFVNELADARLLDAQSSFVETFDRGRKVSLYIFEHVYGESRDRGPAMVELRQVYREHGLEVNLRELPDYLPLLLEFCAQLPEEKALEWLVETTHVLQRIRVRLAERGNGYASAFTVLLRLVGGDPYPEALTSMAGQEKRDDTPEAIDDVWAEKPVTFGPGESHTNCGATRQEAPEPGEADYNPAQSSPGV